MTELKHHAWNEDGEYYCPDCQRDAERLADLAEGERVARDYAAKLEEKAATAAKLVKAVLGDLDAWLQEQSNPLPKAATNAFNEIEETADNLLAYIYPEGE